MAACTRPLTENGSGRISWKGQAKFKRKVASRQCLARVGAELERRQWAEGKSREIGFGDCYRRRQGDNPHAIHPVAAKFSADLRIGDPILEGKAFAQQRPDKGEKLAKAGAAGNA